MPIDNSAGRRIDAFCYGLYMDPDVLLAKRVAPTSPRRCIADGFAVRIGAKATLLRQPGGRACGMVYAVSHSELGDLYSGLEVYKPEALLVRTESGITLPALTMVLLDPPSPVESNLEYEAKLHAALQKLHFPAN